jgi:hypothetical protein
LNSFDLELIDQNNDIKIPEIIERIEKQNKNFH